jgi:ribulose-5-phosphate 4-epimerase/fuculose-1-phosphate aldolase
MTTQKETELRRQIVDIGRRMHDRFFVAANDGNISARLDDETVLMTPTGVSKGFMSPEDILKLRLGGLDEDTIRRMVRRVVYRTAGRPDPRPAAAGRLVTEKDVRAVPVGGQLSLPHGALVTPLAWQAALERNVTVKRTSTTPAQEALAADARSRPSSEATMHTAIYRARGDVEAVVHTHAPATTAFATTGAHLDEPLLPEVLAFIGPVALVPYARAGTLDLPRAMAPYLADHDAFLLANHGPVTVGRTLEEAYFRMERLELFARIRLAAQALGPSRPLPPEEVAQLTAMWERQREGT